MPLPTSVETVVVGAGQAGLVMSWFLADTDHVVLERRATLGGGWQDRWDNFRLVSPAWTSTFPGFPLDGVDPGSFLTRAEITSRVERYARVIGAPVERDTDVRRLSRENGRFRLETNRGDLRAERVVIATGSFQTPRIPAIARDLPGRLTQIHTHHYRRESGLPDGAVLVVGSAQSGVQIAEELAEAGRSVFLSVSTAGRVPRHYRGQDFFRWLVSIAWHGERYGVFLPTVDKLPDPQMRFAGNPHLSGHRGGHDTNLREMAAAGITLLGRIERVEGERIRLAPDLRVNLARADAFFDDRFRGLFDTFIDRAGIDAPPDDTRRETFEPRQIAELDLAESGIGCVIWASGFGRDYDWIDLPIVDDAGHPRQVRGETDVPGLYFLGLLWQYNQASATLFGPVVDARHLAERMAIPVRKDDAHVIPAG
jgi:putative flavoprotein involved in K+ transport